MKSNLKIASKTIDTITNEIRQLPFPPSTYIGQKGYTILKREITPRIETAIKTQLTIHPQTPGCPVQTLDKVYFAYRETDKKLYLPRYFGENLFGKAQEIKMSTGKDIDVEFCGDLRDYQLPIVDAYLKKVENGTDGSGGGGLIEVRCGRGKTVCGLYIVSKLKKKALVIVHKEFLVEQWIERAQQYLPNARIGKIQGNVIDIEDKDIVIAMLQSLSMKDYSASIFEDFGLTIIDEVHHISSEVFSNALFKIVTPYMLGLSATMNRKDGTTYVFKMFLGDVVYKDTSTGDNDVIVRAITYKSADAEYNQVERDYRGNVMASKMISKICLSNHRTEFILKVLQDMLAENSRQQIMIISQYKNILHYIYDAVQHRNISSSIGYYIGGMKKLALKENESKQIILSTYSMAAEALDIKTLTTLMMITPMTSIEQPVGRILRQKHAFSPMVVDIVDTHDNFQNQWRRRRAFYRSRDYRILQTDNVQYGRVWKEYCAKPHKNDNDNDSDGDDNNDTNCKITSKGKCLLLKKTT